ncbi:MAG TPA: cytochrome c [Deltaproteobacteria bacterium]|nr:cytochrome c [Deltaproteobacteria bacterium]
MKTIFSLATWFITVACFMVLTSLPVTSVQAQESDPEALVLKSCGTCHGLNRVCKALGKDATWWESTVNRMVKRGAKLKQEDVQAVAEYLSQLEQGAKFVCD